MALLKIHPVQHTTIHKVAINNANPQRYRQRLLAFLFCQPRTYAGPEFRPERLLQHLTHALTVVFLARWHIVGRSVTIFLAAGEPLVECDDVDTQSFDFGAIIVNHARDTATLGVNEDVQSDKIRVGEDKRQAL